MVKQWIRWLVLVALVAGSVSCGQIRSGRNSTDSLEASAAPASTASIGDAAKETPLLLSNAEPLLLGDDGPEGSAVTSPIADNSRCHVCHLNYAVEEIAVIHARANIGCAKCHGESDEHIADESWASGGNGTAPDIMFPLDTINPACMKCHARQEIESGPHQDFLSGISSEKHCTDCHGEHRLPVRKCKWK